MAGLSVEEPIHHRPRKLEMKDFSIDNFSSFSSQINQTI